jgi:hypothetical protein
MQVYFVLKTVCKNEQQQAQEKRTELFKKKPGKTTYPWS